MTRYCDLCKKERMESYGQYCEDCARKLAVAFGRLIGYSPSWDHYGVDVSWEEIIAFIDRMEVNLSTRTKKITLSITDIELCQVFPMVPA